MHSKPVCTAFHYPLILPAVLEVCCPLSLQASSATHHVPVFMMLCCSTSVEITHSRPARTHKTFSNGSSIGSSDGLWGPDVTQEYLR